MNTSLSDFIRLTKERSKENTLAILTLHAKGLFGPTISLLRQELDSLIRVCYLLRINNLTDRYKLIQDTLSGLEWKIDNNRITDRKMVNIASQYNHWAPEVYDFGNSFTHLTNFHDYKQNDPLKLMDDSKKQAIRKYLNSYHFFPSSQPVTFENVIHYLPQVATKVSDNLHSYLKDLEDDKIFN
jgi:hypothetical protein